MSCDNIIELTDENGNCVVADEGESSIMTVFLRQTDGTPLPVAAIQTLTLTLQNSDGQLIGDWQDKNVLNTNGGTVEDDGEGNVKYTQILGPAENIAFTQGGDIEDHVATATWTYQNGAGTPLTGKQAWLIKVSPALAVTTADSPGWTG